MIRNEGTVDRAARVLLGLVLLALAFRGGPWWLAVVALAPLLTGLAGYCPLYRALGIRSCRAG